MVNCTETLLWGNCEVFFDAFLLCSCSIVRPNQTFPWHNTPLFPQLAYPKVFSIHFDQKKSNNIFNDLFLFRTLTWGGSQSVPSCLERESVLWIVDPESWIFWFSLSVQLVWGDAVQRVSAIFNLISWSIRWLLSFIFSNGNNKD